MIEFIKMLLFMGFVFSTVIQLIVWTYATMQLFEDEIKTKKEAFVLFVPFGWVKLFVYKIKSIGE